MIIKVIIKLIRTEIAVMFILAGTVILFFEMELIPGGIITGASVIYLTEVLLVLMALGLIPLTLKGSKMALERLKRDDFESRASCYRTYAQIRVLAYTFFILYSLILYYLTGRDTGFYCAIIGTVFTAFIFPTIAGVEDEIGVSEKK